jgi:hypothetical protein
MKNTHNKIKSRCCNSTTYEAPSYYTNTMKTHEEKDIPKVNVCIKCGHECEIIEIKEDYKPVEK